MKYPKPSLPFSDQADLLIARRLVAPAKSDIVTKLQAVSHHRLNAVLTLLRCLLRRVALRRRASG